SPAITSCGITMQRIKKILLRPGLVISALAFSWILIFVPTVNAQSAVKSAHGGIQLTAVIPPQLKLSVTDIPLDIEVTDPSQNSHVFSIPVTSSWALDSSTSHVELVGYFDSPTAALVNNAGHAIPGDHVLGGLASDEMRPFIENSHTGTGNANRTLFV